MSTVLIISGVLMLVDAGLTVVWQEPVSAVYAKIVQGRLGNDLEKLERAAPSTLELRALKGLQDDRRRMAFLARALKRKADRGDAVGRIRIPEIGAKYVVVDGTTAGSLRKGPGVYDQTPFPGAPGTVGIAGHRTTYLAPFRNIDDLKRGDQVIVEMPYGRFEYEVQRSRIVKPSEISVVRRVSYDRLVLSACHPLYSAAKRIVVFARLVTAQPRGAATR
ncbi:MAG: class E sortase [Solirubrobacteraceae bacterium]